MRNFIIFLAIITVVGAILIYNTNTSSTIVVNADSATSTVAVRKELTPDEMIDKKMENSKKFVARLVADKQRLNAAQIEYLAALEEYNLTLDAASLYGGGTIEIYSEIANELGLLEYSSETTSESE